MGTWKRKWVLQNGSDTILTIDPDFSYIPLSVEIQELKFGIFKSILHLPFCCSDSLAEYKLLGLTLSLWISMAGIMSPKLYNSHLVIIKKTELLFSVINRHTRKDG